MNRQFAARFNYLGDVVPITAGQGFYYDAIIDGDLNVSDWSAIARAALARVPQVGGSVINADATNIAFNVTSRMDRASQSDLESDLTTAIAAQPGVYAVKGSMLRLLGGSISGQPPAANLPFNIPTWGWVAIGLVIIFSLRK
jgi:hypothetical protein